MINLRLSQFWYSLIQSTLRNEWLKIRSEAVNNWTDTEEPYKTKSRLINTNLKISSNTQITLKFVRFSQMQNQQFQKRELEILEI